MLTSRGRKTVERVRGSGLCLISTDGFEGRRLGLGSCGLGLGPDTGGLVNITVSKVPFPVGGSGWRRSVVVGGVRRMNEVNARRARLVLGWVTVFGRGGYTISVCNQPTGSTQPCISPGSLNRVPASAGVRAGMSPLPGGR